MASTNTNTGASTGTGMGASSGTNMGTGSATSSMGKGAYSSAGGVGAYASGSSGSGTDILSHLQKRHREVDTALTALENSADDANRREMLDQVVHDLAVHTAVEELIFYPAIRKELGDKDPKRFSSDVLHMLEEHHAAKTVLDELYAMGPHADRFKARAGVLAENVRHHVQEEEEIFPELRKYWSDARLRELGEEFIAAEKKAPTRPHPMLPDQGRFMAAMQSVAAAFDKLKDSVRDAVPHGGKTESTK